MENSNSWTTKDEMRSVSFIASNEKRLVDGYVPDLHERRDKLTNWIEMSYVRDWGKNIDVTEVRNYAHKLLSGLI